MSIWCECGIFVYESKGAPSLAKVLDVSLATTFLWKGTHLQRMLITVTQWYGLKWVHVCFFLFTGTWYACCALIFS